MSKRCAIQIISYNRPTYLKQTLESLTSVITDDDRICVVEQSDKDNKQDVCIDICSQFKNIHVIPLFKNFGQRGATNIVYESGFFNDFQYVMLSDHDNLFHDKLDVYFDYLDNHPDIWITSGYHSPEHDIEDKDGNWLLKSSCRAGHIVMRNSDFMKIMPSDTNAGESAWFCGLDWWLTHWAPNSPGHQNKGFIACYPGGVEHIGRASTWQGEYDDEIDIDELRKIRTMGLYDIISKYPPRHEYMHYKYWYEKVSDDEFKSKSDQTTSTVTFNKPQSIVDWDNIKFLETNSDADDLAIDGVTDNSNVIAFNYIWPSYGFAFLEESIRSILPYVKYYVITVNTHSYIGNKADEDSINYVLNVCKKYSRVKVILNDDSSDEKAASDNIGAYFKRMQSYAKSVDIDYVWMVQSDEVYDDDTCKQIYRLILQDEFHYENSNGGFIFQPLCYVDNPHWVVEPPENFQRPTIIHVDGEYGGVKQKYDIIQFHHMSYVMRKNELSYKLNNWGHRDNIDPNHKIRFQNLLDLMKTNKLLEDFHPISPSEYHKLRYVDEPINRRLFLAWCKYLIEFKNEYDSVSHNYKDTVYDFPEDPKNMYTLSPVVRRSLSSILTQFIPSNGNFLEIGSWNGMNITMIKNVANDLNISGMDNYFHPDPLFGQYGDSFFVYIMALKRFITHGIDREIQLYNGWPKKLISILKNESLDAVFINPGIRDETVIKCIVETWPKVKHGGFYIGQYSKRDQIKQILNTYVDKSKTVDCPWGPTLFDFNELYHDLISEIETEFNTSLGEQLGLWIARVKKF